jgi:tetratricopeptide (TPR) repeat protein
MGILDYLKGKKEIDKIVDKVAVYQQAKDLVNKALSYRNINQMQKALDILEIVLNKYPEYKAANQIYGSTLRRAGKIEEAIKFFNNIIAIDNGTGVYGPKEIYANIGSIYYFDKNDIHTALKYYNLALKAPNCPAIDIDGNKLITSSIYRDLSWIFFDQGDYNKSKKFASERLKIITTCPISSKILGLSIINEFIKDECKIKFFKQQIENPNITKSIEYLKIALASDDKDYAVLNGLALAYYLMSIMPYYISDKRTKDSIEKESEKYFNFLSKYSSEDKDAKYYLDMYESLKMNLMMEFLKNEFPNYKITPSNGS